MAAYTKNTPGAPAGGFYLIGDVVTDSHGIEWECVESGHQAKFVAAPKRARAQLRKQAAPAAKTTSTTLTAAELLGGLITGNQGAAAGATYTMPLGSAIETALAALYPGLAADDYFEFTVINISTVAAEVITLAVNTGVTLVGDLTIAANAAGDASQGTFRVRRTAANTYVGYRVA